MSDEMNNRAFYDRISQAYDLLSDAGEREAREAAERLLAAQPGETILEIGYGTGHSCVTLAKAVAPHGHVTGLDISPGMREVAQARLQRDSVAGFVDLQIGDARRLPFEAESFAGVLMSFTLELFPLSDIPQVLSEIKRVLRPGGRFANVSMAAVPNGERESLLERTYVWMHQHFPHIVDCQPIDVEQLLGNAGFQIANQQRMEIWTMPVLATVAVKS